MMARDVFFTADGSPTVVDEQTGATFHSKHGAVQESMHIYINCGLVPALRCFSEELVILEAGWGTGLNTLLTLQELKKSNRKIRYIAIEKNPLEANIIGKLQTSYASDKEEQALFLELHNSPWNRAVQIAPQLVFEKYHADFTAYDINSHLHLVFYDAFAPSVTPEMWQQHLFERLHQRMLPAGMLVTFCASTAFKRCLKNAGYRIESLPGPRGKREITRATK